MQMPKESSSSVDIFGLLAVDEGKDRKRREELLAPLRVKDFFKEGNIGINKRTCWGLECRLCIKACPTNALFWKKTGEIGIVKDLCVYCGACVLSCMVDDCIKVERKRETGEVEKFSKTRDVVVLEDKINAQKRFSRVREVLPNAEAYCERYRHNK